MAEQPWVQALTCLTLIAVAVATSVVVHRSRHAAARQLRTDQERDDTWVVAATVGIPSAVAGLLAWLAGVGPRSALGVAALFPATMACVRLSRHLQRRSLLNKLQEVAGAEEARMTAATVGY